MSAAVSMADLAIRAARAEIERDAAIARAERAEEYLSAFRVNDPEKMLDTLHIMGIPARDLRDIYRVVDEWHRNGGRQAVLDDYRERQRLRRMHP